MYIGNSGSGAYGGVTQVLFIILLPRNVCCILTFIHPYQLRFHPTNSHILYASFRGRISRGRIYAWDLRNIDAGTSNPPYHIFQTYRDTDEEASKAYDINYNQKIFFDVDITGRWMSVGDQVNSFSKILLSGR